MKLEFISRMTAEDSGTGEFWTMVGNGRVNNPQGHDLDSVKVLESCVVSLSRKTGIPSERLIPVRFTYSSLEV